MTDRAPESRAPFVIAGIVAAVPLFALAACAPGGADWRWFEFPRRITALAIAFGLLACFARRRWAALAVPIATAAAALAWVMLDEYRGLARFGRTDLFATELDVLWGDAVARSAPWLVGGLYAVLAWLAIGRSGSRFAAWRNAGAWLVAVGLVAIACTLAVTSWLTLENLGHAGTYRSSVAWPDTKVLSLVLASATCAAGIAFAAWGRREPPPVPPARVV